MSYWVSHKRWGLAHRLPETAKRSWTGFSRTLCGRIATLTDTAEYAYQDKCKTCAVVAVSSTEST
jgi:hypothetical protein